MLFPAGRRGPSAGISGVRSRRPSASELASKSASLVSGRMIGACRSHLRQNVLLSRERTGHYQPRVPKKSDEVLKERPILEANFNVATI